jgi:hypothetical protein
MKESLRQIPVACVLSALLGLSVACNAQTKFYLLGGMSSIYYHNDAHSSDPALGNFYYGLEVDKYLDYHYALTSGVFLLKGGYDNGISRWTNKFIQVPLGIKIAPIGDVVGISAGVNFNFLIDSQLREVADTLNHYYTVDVTSAMAKIQPDLYFGLLIRLNRVTLQMKFAFAITNRYSKEVKAITDAVPKYYKSYYASVLGKEDQSLTSSSTFITLSVRLF